MKKYVFNKNRERDPDLLLENCGKYFDLNSYFWSQFLCAVRRLVFIYAYRVAYSKV